VRPDVPILRVFWALLMEAIIFPFNCFAGVYGLLKVVRAPSRPDVRAECQWWRNWSAAGHHMIVTTGIS